MAVSPGGVASWTETDSAGLASFLCPSHTEHAVQVHTGKLVVTGWVSAYRPRLRSPIRYGEACLPKKEGYGRAEQAKAGLTLYGVQFDMSY